MNWLKNNLIGCLRDESGGEVVEIAVLVALILLGCVALLTLLDIPATERIAQLVRTILRG